MTPRRWDARYAAGTDPMAALRAVQASGLCETPSAGCSDQSRAQRLVPQSELSNHRAPPSAPPKTDLTLRFNRLHRRADCLPCAADDEDALCFDCEDKEVAHASFLKAHRHSRPENVQVDGMQDFAAAVRPHITFMTRYNAVKLRLKQGTSHLPVICVQPVA